MKILITTDWYKPAVNGVVTSVENLAKGLVMTGHDVRILTLAENVHSRKEGNIYYVGSVSAGMIYEKARLKLKMPANIMKDILAWKPDIVHSQCEFSTFHVAREIAYKCEIPLIHTYHTVYEDYTHYFCFSHAMGKKMAKFFSKKVLSDVNAVIVPSEKIHVMLKGYGVNKKIYNIPSGINMEQYESNKSDERRKLRTSLAIEPDECILIYVGRLAKEKNIEELFGFLAKSNQKQRMLIVGDGPYRTELERRAEELGIRKQLIFTGMVSPKQISDYYAAGDIFISASNSETQGLTYMEAMASALPILCRADDCLNDVIENGTNGLLYHTGEEFMQHLEQLKNDFPYRNQMGIMARRSVQKRYSIQAFTQSCLKVYYTAVQQAGGCV
jgi:1,2-diacylglycerol 3-alpha-glucosyltransferase